MGDTVAASFGEMICPRNENDMQPLRWLQESSPPKICVLRGNLLLLNVGWTYGLISNEQNMAEAIGRYL